MSDHTAKHGYIPGGKTHFFEQIRRKHAGLKTQLFRPKAMVVENKNKKVEKFFYSMPYKHLRRKSCLHFCRFSHQTRIPVQLWGGRFWAGAEKRKP
jgi:hypothetical protein